MNVNVPSPRVCRCIIVLLAVLAWGATVKYKFVWDDQSFITDNAGIRSLKNIPAMFYSRIAEASIPTDFPNFRPVRNVAYALLFQVGGGQVRNWIFHLANIIGHAGAAWLLFEVAALLFARLGETVGRWAALMVGGAFAINPAASEVVCWAKSLDDILATVFILASMRQIILWRGEKGRLALALAFFFLASYTKENAVAFAGLVFFVWRFVHKLEWKRCAVMTMPFAVVAVIYMTNRQLVLGQAAQCAPISGSYGQTLIDTLPAITIYFRLLWGIPPFLIDYTNMHGHLAIVSGKVLMGLCLLLVWVAAVWMAWRRERLYPALLGLLWLGFFLLPVSNLIPMMQYLAERFLYLPMAGWLLAVGAAAAEVTAWSVRRGSSTAVSNEDGRDASPRRPVARENFYGPHCSTTPHPGRLGEASLPSQDSSLAASPYHNSGIRTTFAIAAVFFAFWLYESWDRETIWHDEVTLFVRSSLDNPGHARLRENALASIFRLPSVHSDFGIDDRTRELVAAPSIPRNEAEEMIPTLRQGHELLPDEPRLTSALGIAYAMAGQISNAVPCFELATRQSPKEARSWIDLGSAYFVEKNFTGARQAWGTALLLEPTNKMAQEHLRALDKE